MGQECPHCHEMEPLVEQLEKDSGVKVTTLEVYHNAQNQELMMKIAKGGELCGGLPFFFNEKTGDFVCGKCDMKRLKKWAGK